MSFSCRSVGISSSSLCDSLPPLRSSSRLILEPWFKGIKGRCQRGRTGRRPKSEHTLLFFHTSRLGSVMKVCTRWSFLSTG